MVEFSPFLAMTTVWVGVLHNAESPEDHNIILNLGTPSGGASLLEPNRLVLHIADVDGPPSIRSTVHLPGSASLRLALNVPPGRLHEVQSSSDLIRWEAIHSGYRYWSDPPVTVDLLCNPSASCRFYRLFLP
jgi:hypothetical protein